MIEVRRVRPDEAEVLWALRMRGLREHPTAFTATPEEDARLPTEEIRRRIASPDAAVLGAYDDADGGRLVAMVGLYREARVKRMHVAHVWGLYVTTEAQGRGLGGRLLNAAVEAARAFPGVSQVLLSVSDDALAARRIYERAGFRLYGTNVRGICVDGVYLDELLMVRAL